MKSTSFADLYSHIYTSDGVFDHKVYTEKSLSRMIKAKAKADRAAARHAATAPLVAAMLLNPPSTSTHMTPAAEERLVTDAAELPAAEGEEVGNVTPAIDRTETLRSKPVVVGRFMQLMVPILIDVYAASVITPVRVKTLTGLLKAVSFLDAAGLKRVLTVSCAF